MFENPFKKLFKKEDLGEKAEEADKFDEGAKSFRQLEESLGGSLDQVSRAIEEHRSEQEEKKRLEELRKKLKYDPYKPEGIRIDEEKAQAFRKNSDKLMNK